MTNVNSAGRVGEGLATKEAINGGADKGRASKGLKMPSCLVEKRPKRERGAPCESERKQQDERVGEKEKQKLQQQQKRMKVHKASRVNCATVFVCKCKCMYVCVCVCVSVCLSVFAV